MARSWTRMAAVPVAALLFSAIAATPTFAATNNSISKLSVPDNQAAFTLGPGESVTLHLNATLNDGSTETPPNSDVQYQSSNSSVATVDSNGVITALKDGDTTITATDQGQTVTSSLAVVSPETNSTAPIPTTLTSPGTNRTYNLAFDDEFNGPKNSAPNQYLWTYQIGNGNPAGWGNNEQEYYTNSRQNAFLNGQGDLVIQAKQQNMNGFKYTSARINSRNTGSWRYGYIQVRAKLPAGGPGIWPAIWMMPTNNTYGGWPGSGEIDMMEAVDNSMQQVYSTLHFGAVFTYGGTWSDYDPYRQGSYTLPDTGFHTYAVEWTPNHIRFYVDNHLIAVDNSSQWFSGQGQPNAPFDQPFHLIMNIAVGGYWPGYPTANTFTDASGQPITQQMEIDYVRVYRLQKTYAWPLPGRFNASNYITGNNVSTETSTDLQYVKGIVPTPDQPNEPMTPDKDVTYSNGSSTAYNVNVTPGTYEVQYRVASTTNVGALHISLDGQPISSVSVPNTGGTQSWETVSDPTYVTFSASQQGKHSLTVTASGGPFNLHWIRFIPAGPRIIQGFESNFQKFPMGAYTYGDAAMTFGRAYGVENAQGTQVAPAYQGNYDVRLNYHLGKTGTNVSEFYIHPLMNLTPDSGVSFEVYGENTGTEFQMNLEATGHELFNFVNPSHPSYTWKDDFTGWKQITLPFSELKKAASQPDPGTSPSYTTPDLTDVYSIDLLPVTPGATGSLYVDAFRTYDNNNPSQQPPTETFAPVTYQTIPGLINGDSYGPYFNVQLQPTSDTPGIGDGQNVGYIYAKSSMGYFVDVPHTGNYVVDYRVSNGSTAQGDIEMLEDGTLVGKTMVNPTGSWTTWTDVQDVVHLTAGKHTLTLTTTGGNWNLHYFHLAQSTQGQLLGISLNPSSYQLFTDGKTVTADVYGLFSSGFNASSPKYVSPLLTGVTFTSSNKSVATVSKDGTIDPVGIGTTVITATAGTWSTTAQVSVEQALPNGFSQIDVGPVGTAGTASYDANSGLWTVSGSGTDMYAGTDQSHFVYKSVTGDFTMVAHLKSMGDTGLWAKAGLQVRDSLGPNANLVFIDQTPQTEGVQFVTGSNNNIGGGTTDPTPAGKLPIWLKLVRQGTSVTGYWSTDGHTWIEVGQPYTLTSPTVDVGMFVTSTNNGVLNTATFSHLSIAQSGTAGQLPEVPFAGVLPASGLLGAVLIAYRRKRKLDRNENASRP